MTTLTDRLRGGVYGIDRIPLCAEAANELERLRDALELIAAPKRPDGTWNRERLACQQIAAAALKGTKCSD